MIFDSRQHAGQLLAAELEKRNLKPNLVFGLARGGVVVAAEIAAAFKVPLEPLVVRKISPPGSIEFAVGAVARVPNMEVYETSIWKFRKLPGCTVWWDEGIIRRLNLSSDWKKRQIEDKKIEISDYLSQISFTEKVTRPRPELSNIVLADDGAATGATMMAAIGVVRKVYKGPALPQQGRALLKLVVALPVASPDAAVKIKSRADETVILDIDPDFRAVGQFYREFNQVSWDEVKTLLQLNREAYRQTHSREVTPEHD